MTKLVGVQGQCFVCNRGGIITAEGDEPRICLACLRLAQLEEFIARLREMEYALDGGNLDREPVKPPVISEWIAYVEHGEQPEEAQDDV